MSLATKLNDRPVAFPCIMALLAAAIVGWLFAWLGTFLSLFFIVTLCVPSGLILFVWFICTKENFTLLELWFKSWVFCLVAALTFGGSGLANTKWRDYQSRRFVMNVVKSLEKVKRQTGRYPQKLPNALGELKPFHLSYFSQNESYSFTYYNGLMGSYSYDSQTQKWEYLDFD